MNIQYKYKYDYDINNYSNNYINLGTYQFSNFIPIKKIKNDSLILKITYNDKYFTILDMFKYYKVKEITGDFDIYLENPTELFIIDDYLLNNPFVIESNYYFDIYEQELTDKITSSYHYHKFFVSKQDFNSLAFPKRFFIYSDSLLSKNKIYLKIKKYDYYFYNIITNSLDYDIGYFQIGQRNNSSKELYFYNEYKFQQKEDFIFTPVFGDCEFFFINEEKVKYLSDLDFNKTEGKKNFLIQEKGYLKIKCQNSGIIKYIYGKEDSSLGLEPGNRYIISKYNLKNLYLKIYDDNILIPLKFTMLGCKTNCSIEIQLSEETKIILNNTTPIETKFNFTKVYNFFGINIPENIINEVKIELIVGFIEDNLKSYKQIDFIDSLRYLNIEGKEGVIIKIPKDFNEDFYDYSIRINESDLGVQISYDKMEFLAHPNKISKKYRQIIPLFSTNPYLSISNDKDLDNNKFFYISIYNFNTYRSKIIYIQKPNLFSKVKINAINKLPKLKDNKYYYQIPFPKEEYNYISSIFLPK